MAKSQQSWIRSQHPPTQVGSEGRQTKQRWITYIIYNSPQILCPAPAWVPATPSRALRPGPLRGSSPRHCPPRTRSGWRQCASRAAPEATCWQSESFLLCRPGRILSLRSVFDFLNRTRVKIYIKWSNSSIMFSPQKRNTERIGM